VTKGCFLSHSRFDEARDRGTAFHEAIELYWRTGTAGVSLKYQEWIDSFIRYPNLSAWEPLAVELRMIDRRYNVAGTLDLVLRHKENGRLVLCDYKTKNEPAEGKKLNKPNHRAQLGGYLSLLWQRFPELDITSCRIYWVTPSQTFSNDYSAVDCLTSYESARQTYFKKQLPF